MAYCAGNRVSLPMPALAVLAQAGRGETAAAAASQNHIDQHYPRRMNPPHCCRRSRHWQTPDGFPGVRA